MKGKRIFVMLVAVAMLFSLLPATYATTVAEGTCGENLSWSLSDSGVLTITGSGDMEDYTGSAPWAALSVAVTEVVLPDGLTSIGQYAFMNCYELTGVTIPETVTTIGEQAFGSCLKLQTVRIPAGVTELNELAFATCPMLDGIWVDENNPNYSSDASGVLMNKAKTTLIAMPGGITGTYTIPDTVTQYPVSISDYCQKLTGFQVSQSHSAYACEGGLLYSKDMTMLVRVPGGYVGECAVAAGVTTIGEQAFRNCTQVTAINLPDTLVELGHGAFSGCAALTELVFPEGVTMIPTYCFADCTGLQSVTIPASVTTIGNGIFTLCGKLTEIIYTGTREQWAQIAVGRYNDTLEDITIQFPNDADEPADPEYPSSGTCGEGLTWELADGTLTITGTGAMEDVGESQWASNPDVIELVICEGVTAIGEASFAGCVSLQRVSLPSSLETIGCAAFLWCTALESVEIPATVSAVCADAFSGCEALAEVTVGAYTEDGAVATEIADAAFADCVSLTRLVLGNSVTAIGEMTFYGCDALQQVIYCGTEEQWAAMEIGSDNEALTEFSRQYHDYEDGVCAVCGNKAHTHTWEAGVCTGCGINIAVADLNGDGRITAFDAQILAEAKAGLRTLTDAQWEALEDLRVADIKDYILGKN